MAELKVPLITTIIGEGGSGGALAMAVGDAVLMLQICNLLGDFTRGLHRSYGKPLSARQMLPKLWA